MPNRDYIQTIAHELIAKFDTRDPFELCKAIGVEVFYADLGNLKGMYKYLKKNLQFFLEILRISYDDKIY